MTKKLFIILIVLLASTRCFAKGGSMRFIVFLVLMFLTTPAIANINQTTWRPDTCDCEVIYQWDSNVLPEQRIHIFISVKNEPSHVKFMSPQEKYDSVRFLQK